jgi:molybdopterin converting factor small subunit
LRRCSFLLDETAVHGQQEPVTQGSVLDVLPPFAGG